jgi:dienelactone hydrolase
MNRSFITGILLLFLTVCVFGQQPLLNIPFLENMPEIDGMTDGRGTSNCFTDDGAETDVREAIEDVIKNYPVNASEIILAGFSMGGYGAYRIYYEYPAMFKGIAVFPGHPNLATKWLGSGRG